jgi:hypothetical protein
VHRLVHMGGIPKWREDKGCLGWFFVPKDSRIQPSFGGFALCSTFVHPQSFSFSSSSLVGNGEVRKDDWRNRASSRASRKLFPSLATERNAE